MYAQYIFILALFFTPSIFAEPIAGLWEVQSGNVQYYVHFPLKELVGKSQRVKGKGGCEKGECQFLVAAPIQSFDSGDGNRDSHMQEVAKSALYPMAVVKINYKGDLRVGSNKADVEVNFAGKTHIYKNVPLQIELTSNNQAKATGNIPIYLSHFAVERPSLLGVSIDDNVEISFDLIWKKNSQ